MGIKFAGSNTAVSYGNSSRMIFTNVPAISASFWINNLTLSYNPGFLDITIPGGSSRMEALWSSSSNIIRCGGRALDSDSFKFIDSTYGTLDSGLHHIVIVFDYSNDSAFIYIDGVINASNTNMGWTAGNCSNTPPDDVHFGSANNFFNNSTAEYYDIRFYKRALTAKEVSTIYASEGSDDIINNLELWIKAIEATTGVTITTTLLKDYSENGWTVFDVLGSTKEYIDDPLSIL